MAWIELTTKSGYGVVFNTRNIAYIAAPPEEEAESGVGAGIAMIDNTQDVIPVRENWMNIARIANNKEITNL